MDDKNQPITESDSLETADSPATVSESKAGSVISASQDSGVVSPNAPKSQKKQDKNKLKAFLSRVNIYFVFLIAVLFILIGLSYYAIVQNRNSAQKNALNTQKLTQDALDKLAGTDSQIGDPKQTLSIESNAIFSGGILVRGSIDVAGTIKVGGNLSLPGLSVGGTTSVDQLAAKSLTVAGDLAIQGKATIQNGLSVTGTASFSGNISAPQLTVDRLQLNGDLQFSHHLDPGGGSPSRTNGSALGSGGTSTNSGNDTAGTVTINTGGSAPAGCFMTLTFTKAFGAVPHVILSPASSSAAGLDYYTNRTTGNFSVCTASDPPDSTSGIIFDYVVLD